jgi:mRNA-degrading endonuclease RelE of RelBE toxin-antitoxin system
LLRTDSRGTIQGKENSLAYVIEYSPDAEDHLRRLATRQQRTVVDAVDRQLVNQPTVETRNRKSMRPNPIAPWELRIGDLRVYYEVSDEPQPRVTVLAIGIKERDRVRIGGEIIKL